jgi:hypothetical protein
MEPGRTMEAARITRGGKPTAFEVYRTVVELYSDGRS